MQFGHLIRNFQLFSINHAHILLSSLQLNTDNWVTATLGDRLVSVHYMNGCSKPCFIYAQICCLYILFAKNPYIIYSKNWHTIYSGTPFERLTLLERPHDNVNLNVLISRPNKRSTLLKATSLVEKGWPHMRGPTVCVQLEVVLV